MNHKLFLLFWLVCDIFMCFQPDLIAQGKHFYWQQEIEYTMDIEMNVASNTFTGHQTIKYKNNSPDALDKIFFHLYLNAFQPGSAMDIRSRNIEDPDPRIGARIVDLTSDEIGYQTITKLTQDGIPLEFIVEGTILEVKLAKPIKSGKSAKFEMKYYAQVPVQIRRNGRDNAEGIRYSMSQWFPKLCEYDRQGWHAHPYIGREFYGVWGDFDVSITIDSSYTLAASGVLQNANVIGHGYALTPKNKIKGNQLTWHFVAKKVHDFVWAADPDYVHDVHTCDDGVLLHAFYTPHERFTENWQILLPIMEEALRYINANFGQYPYPHYSFIQAGDGGMEYPMATLITGHRSLTSLVGVSVHELMHSWYQLILGFNENYYAWMDEGFTNYTSERVMNHLRSKGLIPGTNSPVPFQSSYKGYSNLVSSGNEEPLSTHADLFEFNSAYSIATYNKGVVFLSQLEYVIGRPVFDKGMIDFFNSWKFKHPNDNDFIREMEKVSGLELDWYKDYMVYTTKTIDYGVDTVVEHEGRTLVVLSREGTMAMPIDVQVIRDDNAILNYSIPLDIMRGHKLETPAAGDAFLILPDWQWVDYYYVFELPYDMDRIQSITIDPTKRLADLVPDNNIWPMNE